MQDNKKDFLGVPNTTEEEVKRNQSEQAQEQALVNDFYYNTFNTSAGKKALEHLVKKFVKPKYALVNLGKAGEYYPHWRQGQADVISYIEDKMNSSINRRKKADGKSK